jgi:hypothetical protein
VFAFGRECLFRKIDVIRAMAGARGFKRSGNERKIILFADLMVIAYVFNLQYITSGGGGRKERDYAH